MGAAYAAAQLVKFRQAEAVGTVDEDSVGLGDVQTVFDDSCSHHYVGFISYEFEHDAFELFFAHLAVADDYASFGNEFLNEGSERIYRFDAVVDEIDLAVA